MGILYQCLAAILFVNRYVAGLILRGLRANTWDVHDDSLEPTVTVIVPMFNEGRAIIETLESLVALDYPAGKLEIICIDDCSSDDSLVHAKTVTSRNPQIARLERNERNLGKRMTILHATRAAVGEIIVTVDSDVVVEPDAIKQLVRRFTDPRIAAVGGWVDVRNKHETWLTRMQVVKYWYSYFLVKNLEWAFRQIMCLSGCLTAYRKSVLLAIEPQLANRTLMGLPINYGEDRFLTRQLIKAGYLTTQTLTARCRTSVPTNLSTYFSQQLRWRRSTIVDYAGLMTHVVRMNPVLVIHFMALFSLLFVYPAAIFIAVLKFKLLPALALHVQLIVLFGLYYRWSVRKHPPLERVSILAIVPLAIIMPLSYVIQTPLALFTLDSGSWETRQHPPVTKQDAAKQSERAA